MAEVLLRLGCTLVGWMVVYTHLIWLATLRVIGCSPDGDEMWRLLLGFAPFAVGFAFLLTALRGLPDVSRILRWLAIPLTVLLPVAAIPVVVALAATTLGNESICGGAQTTWHVWWAPIQFAALLVIGWRAWRAWRHR